MVIFSVSPLRVRSSTTLPIQVPSKNHPVGIQVDDSTDAANSAKAFVERGAGARSGEMRQATRELAQRGDSAGCGAGAPVAQLLQRFIRSPTGARAVPNGPQLLAHAVDGLQ